ncbi:MAG: hypothetical protein HYY30_12000 [Chloroflexi bacterium]|nr:hypothetical protein [Chloroflexota bacterium]
MQKDHEKETRVHRMFAGIAGRYDLLNTLMTANRYLPNSLTHFPSRREVLAIYAAVGLKSARCHDLMMGMVTVFVGTKG